jgi:hypothetical protein
MDICIVRFSVMGAFMDLSTNHSPKPIKVNLYLGNVGANLNSSLVLCER